MVTEYLGPELDAGKLASPVLSRRGGLGSLLFVHSSRT